MAPDLDERLSETPGWIVEVFAACDASEFGADFIGPWGQQIWTNKDGEPVSTTVISSSPGPEHCDWQSATFLHLGRDRYIRDPEGVLAGHVATPFDPAATLPGDAADTGLRRGDTELWLPADGQVAYVVVGDVVEAWPRIDVGCA